MSNHITRAGHRWKALTRFTLRQALVTAVLCSFWIGSTGRLLYLFGWAGVTSFAPLLAVLAVVVGRIALANDSGWISRMAATSALGIAVCCVSFPHRILPEFEIHARTQDSHRLAVKLQRQLDQRPQFSQVRVRYFAPHNVKGKWILVSGQVRTQAEKNELMSLVEKSDDRHIDWTVAIGDS
ncbi:MAG: hypothetical protein QGG36_28940 [Pirellulaceae bacterium]|jgi:hypothetical protein|nr:hypothetical protein [Pirellulaceae bacterium]MDP7019860.1 hypothetical protein [Pirellulaceae bacterium]